MIAFLMFYIIWLGLGFIVLSNLSHDDSDAKHLLIWLFDGPLHIWGGLLVLSLWPYFVYLHFHG